MPYVPASVRLNYHAPCSLCHDPTACRHPMHSSSLHLHPTHCLAQLHPGKRTVSSHDFKPTVSPSLLLLSLRARPLLTRPCWPTSARTGACRASAPTGCPASAPTLPPPRPPTAKPYTRTAQRPPAPRPCPPPPLSWQLPGISGTHETWRAAHHATPCLPTTRSLTAPVA